MPLVLSVRVLHPERVAPHVYLDHAHRVAHSAPSMGASLIGWSSSQVSLVWDEEALDDALLFAMEVKKRVRGLIDLVFGLAAGDLETLTSSGNILLGYGPALQMAEVLADLAEAGQFLVHDGVEAVQRGDLRMYGEPVLFTYGDETCCALFLDLDDPWIRTPQTLVHPPPSTAESVPPNSESLRALVRRTIGTDSIDARIIERLSCRREQATGFEERIRASMWLSIANAECDEREASLLDATEALWLARSHGDRQGERASLVLLAKLYRAAGYVEFASALLSRAC